MGEKVRKTRERPAPAATDASHRGENGEKAKRCRGAAQGAARPREAVGAVSATPLPLRPLRRCAERTFLVGFAGSAPLMARLSFLSHRFIHHVSRGQAAGVGARLETGLIECPCHRAFRQSHDLRFARLEPGLGREHSVIDTAGKRTCRVRAFANHAAKRPINNGENGRTLFAMQLAPLALRRYHPRSVFRRRPHKISETILCRERVARRLPARDPAALILGRLRRT